MTLRVFGIHLEHKPALACNRHALSADERRRHFDELGPKLRLRIKSVGELADGYRFEFPSDEATFELVSQWAEGERRCCPFFEIELGSGAGAVWLRLTGREGAKAFIRSELAQFFESE